MANTDRPRSIRFYLNDPLDASLEEFMAIIGEKNFTSYVKERIFEHLMEMTEYKFKNSYTSKGVQATLAVNFLKELQTMEGINMDLQLVNQKAVKPTPKPITSAPPVEPIKPVASTQPESDSLEGAKSHDSGLDNTQPKDNIPHDNEPSAINEASEEIRSTSQENEAPLSENSGDQELVKQEVEESVPASEMTNFVKAFSPGAFKLNTNG